MESETSLTVLNRALIDDLGRCVVVTSERVVPARFTSESILCRSFSEAIRVS